MKIVEDLKMQGDVSCHTHISQCLYDMKRALVAVAKQAIKLSEEKEMVGVFCSCVNAM